jgi:hypothetical protein
MRPSLRRHNPTGTSTDPEQVGRLASNDIRLRQSGIIGLLQCGSIVASAVRVLSALSILTKRLFYSYFKDRKEHDLPNAGNH